MIITCVMRIPLTIEAMIDKLSFLCIFSYMKYIKSPMAAIRLYKNCSYNIWWVVDRNYYLPANSCVMVRGKEI